MLPRKRGVNEPAERGLKVAVIGKLATAYSIGTIPQGVDRYWFEARRGARVAAAPPWVTNRRGALDNPVAGREDWVFTGPTPLAQSSPPVLALSRAWLAQKDVT